MKRIMIFLMFVPIVSMAQDNLDMRIQMLDYQIEELTHQRDEKYKDLKQCEKTTKGFKIAGITTLVATGVGVVGNIELAEKLNKSSSGGGGGKAVNYSRSKEEIQKSNTNRLCKRNPTLDMCK